MEGVGARLGRSSTRYGPTATFTGPVRKWKKKWVPLSNPANNNSSSNASAGNNNSRSGLLLYKWTPLNNGSSASNGDAPEPPKKRKYRYVPVTSLSLFVYLCLFNCYIDVYASRYLELGFQFYLQILQQSTY
jgi:hypothetical protein